MKKFITAIFLVVVIQGIGYTQDINREAQWREDILRGLDTAKQDSSRVLLMAEFSNYYKLNRPDSAVIYGYRALTLARKIKFAKGELTALHTLIITQLNLGNDSKALQMCLQANKIAEQNNMSYYKALVRCFWQSGQHCCPPLLLLFI